MGTRRMNLALILPLLAVVGVTARPENERFVREIHKHHHIRQASPEDSKDIPILKRAKYVKTVTELLYITVDQNGVPWGTSVETATPEHVEVYVASSSSTSHHQHHSNRLPNTSSEIIEEPSTSYVLPSSSSIYIAPEPSTSIDSDPEPKHNPSGGNRKFENGKIPCSRFPSSYGALALDYLGNGGWSGIQYNGGNTNECCEGALCSYACASGQSKTQWPSEQPASGESHGGLLCSNGFLTLTRPEVPYLCANGKGSASVKNKMCEPVAICRTDYPGTENMVIPTYVLANGVQPLTVVDAHDYYVWKGGLTSAQYYVNKAGVSQEEGCLWGTQEALVGNFAPLVFGAGYSNGMTCISMLPNPEAKGAKLGYDVEIVGVDGTILNKECWYRNGVFSGGDPTGCTVCFTEGNAQFVLSGGYC